MTNMRIWEDLCKTDPKHTKPFTRAGGFKGTAIRPIYSVERMTERFGPYGQGWGIKKPAYVTMEGVNKEILVFCTVCLWWTDGGRRCSGFGVGGDKVVTYIPAKTGNYPAPERWQSNDEAYKMALTDAMGNAMKFLGMSADIHKGQFDDNKYVEQMYREFSEEAHAAATPAPTPTPRPVQVQRGTARAPEPTPEPVMRDLTDEESDFIIWIEGFKTEFLTKTDYTSGKEYWTEHRAVLDNMKEKCPRIYEDLFNWVREKNKALPKVG